MPHFPFYHESMIMNQDKSYRKACSHIGAKQVPPRYYLQAFGQQKITTFLYRESVTNEPQLISPPGRQLVHIYRSLESDCKFSGSYSRSLWPTEDASLSLLS
ncbi:hypothetical protein AVEN_99701-1 [Araneus ventricosus]|uniref:Uncharacterized protein n=1 Tax=Araneus ventricosus TaxID=182803 RepID=A0A4Y2T3E5_ARAVE|nr:hypothetical protein AVEN_99701-1 [Araneus ventricosus]